MRTGPEPIAISEFKNKQMAMIYVNQCMYDSAGKQSVGLKIAHFLSRGIGVNMKFANYNHLTTF